jgi:hypothetical protein
MAQPVGDVLAGNTLYRAVLHQTNIIDIQHLGTAAPWSIQRTT